jgi:hypothetical protein
VSSEPTNTEASREWVGRLDSRVTRLEVQMDHLSAQTQHLEEGIKSLRAEMMARLDGLSGKLDRLTMLLLSALGVAAFGLLLEVLRALGERGAK